MNPFIVKRFTMKPLLSLVIGCQERSGLAACLESLGQQRGLQEHALEIIVAAGTAEGVADLVAAYYPAARIVRPAPGVGLPHLLGAGIMQTRGAWVALSEAHCSFPPAWAICGLALAHTGDVQVLGGAVEASPELGRWALALFLCDYAAFLPPFAAGPTKELAGNNVIFARDLLTTGEDYSQHGFWKTFFCQRLAQQGVPLQRDARIMVSYGRKLSLRKALARRFQHGRCFGAMRRPQLSRLQQRIYPLAAVGLPLLLTWRVAARVWQRPAYRPTLLPALPAIAVLMVAWVVGELFGHLWGSGASCVQL